MLQHYFTTMKGNKENIVIDNRKARFNYTFLDEYQAGIVLQGCEIKSIRNNDVNMSDSYCTSKWESFCGKYEKPDDDLYVDEVFLRDGELFVKNLHISPYKNSGFSYKDYDPKRDRKILLTKRELRKLDKAVKTKGNTIVPSKMYINEKGLVKLTICLAKGKHNYDKSQAIKERDLSREMRDFE